GRSRKVRTMMVIPIGFCAQGVLTEALIMSGAAPTRARQDAPPPFPVEELRAYLEGNAAALPPGYAEISGALRELAADVAQHYTDLEALEQRLTVLEEKMLAAARLSRTD